MEGSALGAEDGGALALEPADAAAERGLHLALHGVRLVDRHPPPPLGLRVAEAARARDAGAAHAPLQRLNAPGGGGVDVEGSVVVLGAMASRELTARAEKGGCWCLL